MYDDLNIIKKFALNLDNFSLRRTTYILKLIKVLKKIH
jgi:hypothetical protein